MKFFKIITYVFVIGFIIDLIGDFFSVDKMSDDFKALTPRSRIASIVSAVMTVTVAQFASVGWVVFTFFVGFCSMVFYYIDDSEKEEKESKS